METRVEKYKKYRDSIVKEETPDIKEAKVINENRATFDTMNGTTTLPIDQVIQTIDSSTKEGKFLREQQTKKIIKYCIIGLVAALIIAALIIYGVIVFGS